MSEQEPSPQPDLFNAPQAPQREEAMPHPAPKAESPSRKPSPVKSNGDVAAPRPAPGKLGVGTDAAREIYLSDREVAKRYNVSRPTIWRWCDTNPGFPCPSQLSPGTTRWALSELLVFESRTKRYRKQTEEGGQP